MKKKYLYYFFLIFIARNTFGDDYIEILSPISPQLPIKLETGKLPEKLFDPDAHVGNEYKYMNLAMQYIANQLKSDKQGYTIQMHEYTKKKLLNSNQKYTIFNLSNISGASTSTSYFFKWEKKYHSKLQGLEKHIANYYKANKNSHLEFLYPYKRSDKNEFGKIDKDPWAIMINKTMYSFLWMEATKKKVADSQVDEFVKIKDSYIHKFINPGYEDPIILFKVLVDEKSQIIAKNINGTISCRTN